MLSDKERAMLAEIEAGLYAEDPKLARSLRSSGREVQARGFLLGTLLTLAGLGIIVWGVASTIIALGVLGFCLALAGATWGWTAMTKGEKDPKSDKKEKTRKSKDSWNERLERRWEQRKHGEL